MTVLNRFLPSVTCCLLSAAFCLLFSLTLGSCKKTTDGSNNPSGNYAEPLLPESSGWKRVGTVKNTLVLANYNYMIGYDLTVNNTNFQVLYTSYNTGSVKVLYKATNSLNSSAETVLTPLTKAFLGFSDQNSPSRQGSLFYFRPNTYNMESAYIYSVNNFYDNLNLYGETSSFGNYSSNTGMSTSLTSFKIYPDGDIICGSLDAGYATRLNYYHRATNVWTDSYSRNYADNDIACAPFRLDDGTLLACRLNYNSVYKKMYLSITDTVPAKLPYNTSYPERCKEEHKEYAPDGVGSNGVTPTYTSKASFGCWTTEGNSIIVVIAYTDTKTNVNTLSAYKWTKGNTSFQKLYSGIAITSALAVSNGGITNNNVICNIDGTVSALILENKSYRLAVIGAGGEKSYGISSNTYDRYVATMSCLRYFNGSYYAVVSPEFFGENGEGQHLDIVKLTL